MPQNPWPSIMKRERVADFLSPDGYLRHERPVAGPLRMGTEPRVGPRGLVAGGTASDFEMDRISKRGFDPLGTPDERTNVQESSPLLSRAVRARPTQNRDSEASSKDGDR